jgi:hypothetical protein
MCKYRKYDISDCITVNFTATTRHIWTIISINFILKIAYKRCVPKLMLLGFYLVEIVLYELNPIHVDSVYLESSIGQNRAQNYISLGTVYIVLQRTRYTHTNLVGKRAENMIEIVAYIKGRSLLGLKTKDIHGDVCVIMGRVKCRIWLFVGGLVELSRDISSWKMLLTQIVLQQQWENITLKEFDKSRRKTQDTLSGSKLEWQTGL